MFAKSVWNLQRCNVMSGYVIIDRRLSSKGRSSTNRKLFLNRLRSAIKQSVSDITSDVDVTNITKGSKKVRVPVQRLYEPSFNNDLNTGINNIVFTGNERYIVGDRIERPQSQQGSGGAGQGEGGEDDFTFELTKEEFLDYFFESCELPDLLRKEFSKVNELEHHRAGYSVDGAPSALNIVRSMRHAKSRKFGFAASKKARIRELEQFKAQLLDDPASHPDEINKIDKEIAELQAKIKAIPFIDPVDLRYNAWTETEIPAIQAVMFCVMDVSGSMGQQHKKLAKTFYMLLYLFLERNYDRVDIVWIRHHTQAQEVDEHTFFHEKTNGGTTVSPALQLVDDIINDRYPLNAWNIYVAQATDGDNWYDDNELTQEILETKIIPKVQYYAYTQINPGEDDSRSEDNSLWRLFEHLSDQYSNVAAARIFDQADVYPVFKQLFDKKHTVKG